MTTYKVHILLGKNMGSASTANCWINLSGSLANTGTIAIPRGDLEFRFMVSSHFTSTPADLVKVLYADTCYPLFLTK